MLLVRQFVPFFGGNMITLECLLMECKEVKMTQNGEYLIVAVNYPHF